MKASTKPPTRARAIFLLDQLGRAAQDAQAIGVALPDGDVSWFADGIGQKQAKAWLDWGLGHPKILAAIRNSSHPMHQLVSEVREALTYFAFDHPAKPDGSPEPMPGPISPALAAYALGLRKAISVDELLPQEAAVVAEMVGMIPEYRAGGAAQRAELEALHARAAEQAAPETTGASEQENTEMPENTGSQNRAAELKAALGGKLSATDRVKIRDELADLLERQPELAAAAAAAPVRKNEFNVMAAGDNISAGAVELTDRLRGNSRHGSAERQADLAALEAELRASDVAPPAEGGPAA